ncbi:MAG: hypothetical protein V4489_06180 [Chlamydiota bacterium]
MNLPSATQGFIVGADSKQEWLLPWWWERYSKYNQYPVTFVDFGLSQKMKEWCKKQGNYIELPIDVPTSIKNFHSTLQIESWEKRYGQNFWESRNAWFKKPLACLQAPYTRSVWMDLDCEVRGSLSPLFSLPFPSEGVAVTKEYVQGKELGINSGVIVFQKGATIIQDWAKASLEKNYAYPGDQDALYDLIIEKKVPLYELPIIYNQSRFSNNLSDAIVIHWHGEFGKSVIRDLIATT